MMKLSSAQKIGMAVALLVFAAIKITLLFWWQQQQTPAQRLSLACDVKQSCEFVAGQSLQLIGVGNNQTPFAARINGLPEQVKKVSVSFDMRDMDMGFNRFDLQKQPDGSWYAAPIYLPLCRNNRHDWLIRWQVDEREYQAEFTTLM